MTKIEIVPNSMLEKRDLFGKSHFYYEFNKEKHSQEIIVIFNVQEHYNNLEMLKFSMLCKKYNTKLIVYTHINEFPLVSTFADAGIFFDGDIKEVYTGITKYNYDQNITNNLFNTFLSSPHGINDVVALSRVKTKWPLLLNIAEKEISDEEVCEYFCFPKISIRKSSFAKFLILSSVGEIKEDKIVCEIKISEDKPLGYDAGEILFENLIKCTSDFPVEIIGNKNKKNRLAQLCGDDYMGVQVLSSFVKNWMWVCFGGSSNIFPFFPVKILSLADQTLCENLIRKISIKRFGKIGELLPEFNSLIYCMPSEKDGESRTDGQPPLPNLYKATLELLSHNIKYELIFLEESTGSEL